MDHKPSLLCQNTVQSTLLTPSNQKAFFTQKRMSAADHHKQQETTTIVSYGTIASVNSSTSEEAPLLTVEENEKQPQPQLIQQEEEKKTEEPAKKKRLVSLDAFRGLTIWFMILVNNSGGSYAILEHSAWDGVTIADFVMPCFLFIVGASISLSILPLRAKGETRWELLKKAAVRTFKLLVLGLILQGADFPVYDLTTLRIPGVLQRIAVDYFFVTCVVIFLPVIDPSFLKQNKYLADVISVPVKYISYWLTAASIFIIFVCVTYGTAIPDCGHKRGQVTPACNAAGLIDKAILTTNHMYSDPTCLRAIPPCKYFDPEGLFSTFGSSLSTFFGLYFGFILYTHKSHRVRLAHWIPLSLILLLTGITMHFAGLPLNKNLYSISYIFLMAGTAGLLLSLCYILIDIPDNNWFQYAFMPFIVLGMNSIAIYAGDEFLPYIIGVRNGDGFIFWKGDQRNNVTNWFYQNILLYGRSVEIASLFYALTDVTFWVIVAAVMYKKKIFIKI